MSKQQHLVPEIILDLGNKALDNKSPHHIRDNYVMRIEAIRDYCAAVLDKNAKTAPVWRK